MDMFERREICEDMIGCNNPSDHQGEEDIYLL